MLMRKMMLILGLLTLILAACSGMVGRSGNKEAVNGSGTLIANPKILGSFYPIDGTQYQLASIISSGDGEGSYDFTQLFSRGRSDYSVYNYVFLDTQSESVYALLPSNEDSILSIQGYPVPDSNATPKIPVAWWFYTLAKDDTNQDEKLTLADEKTLAISDVGGKGYTELVSGVDVVLGDVYKDGNILLLIYRAKDKNFLAHVDLTSRKVTQTTELPSFGDDVK